MYSAVNCGKANVKLRIFSLGQFQVHLLRASEKSKGVLYLTVDFMLVAVFGVQCRNFEADTTHIAEALQKVFPDWLSRKWGCLLRYMRGV